MLTGFVFDEQQSEQVEDWRAAIGRLDGGQLLWLALHDPTEEELAALGETLDLGEALAQRLGEHPRGASVADEGERMYVTLYVVNSGGDAPELVPIECVLGVNWIVTAYRERADVLEEFFERVQGGGEVGALDAPSFVATILDWIVSSYLRALDEVERELEDLDARVMTNTPKMATDDLNRLVEIRRTIGTLRRALAPHREVVVSSRTLNSIGSRPSSQLSVSPPSSAAWTGRWTRPARRRSRPSARSISSSPESANGQTTS